MSLKDSDENRTMVQIGRIEINPTEFNAEPVTDDLPLLPTRNLVLFPGVTIPISLTRENSIEVAKAASEQHIPVGIICQVNPDEESPNVTRGLYRYGVVADIYEVLELPDGTKTALVHGRQRFRVLSKSHGATLPVAALSVKVSLLEDNTPNDNKEFDAVAEQVTKISEELIEKTSGGDKSYTNMINNLPDPTTRINFIATNIPAEPAEKINLLSKGSILKRAYDLLAILLANRERINLTQDIMEKAGQRMKDNQRSAFLQMQLDTIKEELYGTGEDADDDFEALEKRASKINFPKDVRATFDKELSKLRRLNPQSPDYTVQYSYLEGLLELPWNCPTKTNTDINKAKEILENDHYGLEKVKQRILEQIAVIINNPKTKSPIICLVGPPGVGKTSLGRSIARAMGRKYQRVALGGLHDESEIRGHRRTYVGAMPGRILKAMKAAATTNPVLLLDEVDKVGKDYKGDPSSALLEVLDPEQNSTFHDNFIEVDYDLSNVLFIATANNASAIETPLLDRMEVIDLSGYLLEEKIEIAHRHLIPKALKDNGLNEKDAPFTLPDRTLIALIENYTAESGVRKLENLLSSLVRKAILAKLSGEPLPSTLEPSDLQTLLGLPRYNKDKYEGNEFTGVVTGLAWTQVGGEILLAEAALSPGKGDRLTITGNLGDVMKESATIALQWVKAHCEKLSIPTEMFDTNNLHIHFPEGAIPKDGPSAGITVATAIASAFTGRRVRERIAMTGEITLRGKVLPVGGIKEKILAAKRAGIDTIVLSSENRRDIEDITSKYRDGLTFHYVNTVDEVMDFALLDK